MQSIDVKTQLTQKCVKDRQNVNLRAAACISDLADAIDQTYELNCAHYVNVRVQRLHDSTKWRLKTLK